MPIDAKAAEKTCMSRAGSEHWERTKPFAPPGHDMLPQDLPLILDFTVAVTFLDPKWGERVLDLGAGSCWVSEWLQRLNVETVSVDISVEMLGVGRDRLPRKTLVAAGDLEHLPLRSASFDKALCPNAFHHVPDVPKALAEIGRVLRPGGRIVFSEPGRGHAEAATSERATGEFGVTEQDILVAGFLESCRAASFSSARIKPMSYAIPQFELNAGQWTAWNRLALEAARARAAQALARRRRQARRALRGGSLARPTPALACVDPAPDGARRLQPA
jgi:SAM-dependent methyltransferase